MPGDPPEAGQQQTIARVLQSAKYFVAVFNMNKWHEMALLATYHTDKPLMDKGCFNGFVVVMVAKPKTAIVPMDGVDRTKNA